MSEVTALVTSSPAAVGDGFADTAADRFDDAVRERAGGATDAPSRTRSLLVAVREQPLLVVSVVWLVLVIVSALVPALLAPGDPLLAAPADKLQGPSLAHLFGTDQIGRDLFTRVVHGTGLTISAASAAVLVGLVIGALLGLVAGFLGGWVDSVIMRIADVLLAIPSLLLSLAIIAALGFGTINVAIAVGVASIAAVSRIMRAEVIRVRSAPFIEAAGASGNTRLRVLLRHVLPNSVGPVLVLAVLEFGGAILAVSALGFLGYGAQPPTPEWGSLVSDGRDFLRTSWWLTTLPGLVIALTVLAANRVSRALDRDGEGWG
ncbi:MULTISPECIES: ABC transporter permease [Microbacterium]|jgi:peptide/nickel transport system permease protein|uniref:ABC transporter permease n=2 Tax=Microbacteriaceae TaxID=85023 RepID=UPI0006F565DD|nr:MULTISPECIES: ABC transporter permease [unclassified Microbacterium]KQR99259.1 peptide ABC transporter permease [Microbacterium sp. Leaf347]MBN9199152.1 ABC transporter permease [Microbacterium ginsengisoli]ODU52794.1 MAG: peptide ABC transporter permease [Microbacterium sp. SCN 70-10]OJU74934.1 MAG: peptide ABC transporter permease [Microbacterium sp. 71-23]